MNINRHNYEEFLILYLDNELSSAQRRMVEDFLALHPDLKEEFDLLQHYKLNPDEQLVYEGKNDLLNIPVNAGELQEQLLLYIDSELPDIQRNELEKKIIASDPLKKELVLLQKTKLQPAPFVFAGKEILYEKHLQPERQRRFVFLYNWRAAAAVLILLLGGGIVLLVNNKRRVETGIAKNIPVKGQSRELNTQVNTITPVAVNVTVPGKNKDQKANNELTTANNKTSDRVPEKKTNASNQVKVQPVTAQDNNSSVASNNLPQPLRNGSTGVIIDPVKTTDIEPVVTGNPNKLNTNPNVLPVTTDNSAQNNKGIQQAVYAENENPGDNEKKSRLRGIFRKLTRLVEKRTGVTPDNDGKIAVAAFRFNTN